MIRPMRNRARRVGERWVGIIAALGIAASALLAGCAPIDNSVKIALLLPDSKTARYATFDRPYFEQRIAELGEYQVLYSNAEGDAAAQQSQAESALAGNLPPGAESLGVTADPRQVAQTLIDTLAMLEAKTAGQLDPDEAQLLSQALTALRFRFVQGTAH